MKSQLLQNLVLVNVFAFLMSFEWMAFHDRLLDGKYAVEFKRYPESNFLLVKKGTKITKETMGGVKEEGTIDWRDASHFVMSMDTTTNGNAVAKPIISGLGSACYELNRNEGDKIYFRLTRSADFRIYLDEGAFTKMDD